MIQTRFIRRGFNGWENRDNHSIPLRWDEETGLTDVIRDMGEDGYWYCGDILVRGEHSEREAVHVFQKKVGGLAG